jgi:hypothetical protein
MPSVARGSLRYHNRREVVGVPRAHHGQQKGPSSFPCWLPVAFLLQISPGGSLEGAVFSRSITIKRGCHDACMTGCPSASELPPLSCLGTATGGMARGNRANRRSYSSPASSSFRSRDRPFPLWAAADERLGRDTPRARLSRRVCHPLVNRPPGISSERSSMTSSPGRRAARASAVAASLRSQLDEPSQKWFI